METFTHDLSHLFGQLGLSDKQSEIEKFIAAHKLSSFNGTLPEAPFWNSAQARFLKEGVVEDSDWAEAIDQLDALLRH